MFKYISFCGEIQSEKRHISNKRNGKPHLVVAHVRRSFVSYDEIVKVFRLGKIDKAK
ncbi:hypothetical protein ACFL1X_00900 [Candidatus Hydrogenedentota bacterium]